MSRHLSKPSEVLAGTITALATAMPSRSERQRLANPPFNDFDWFRKDDDVRWQYGVPPKGNANFAWVHHFIHHLALNGSPKGRKTLN